MLLWISISISEKLYHLMFGLTGVVGFEVEPEKMGIIFSNSSNCCDSRKSTLSGFVSLPCTWLRGGCRGTGVQRCPPNHLHFGAGLPILPWFFLEASVRGSGPSTRGRSGSKQRTDKTASAPETVEAWRVSRLLPPGKKPSCACRRSGVSPRSEPPLPSRGPT